MQINDKLMYATFQKGAATALQAYHYSSVGNTEAASALKAAFKTRPVRKRNL
jgi:hypothetical protein